MDKAEIPSALADAQEYFDRTTRDVNLKEQMQEAHEKGEERTARTVNIFVHPEFAWHRDYSNEPRASIEEPRERYRAAIAAALASSDRPIVISFDGARNMYDGFDYDDSLAIRTPDPAGDGTVQGMLDASGMRCFLDQIENIRPDDRLLIHGAAFNRCPTHFAKQLLGLSVFGRFFAPANASRDSDSAEYKHQRAVLEALYHSWFIVNNTRIRLGIQHNTRNDSPDSLTQDLVEEGVTKIYPSVNMPKNKDRL